MKGFKKCNNINTEESAIMVIKMPNIFERSIK